MYNTTVFANGIVIRWRLRTAAYDRFKVLLTDEQAAYFDFNYDDCNGKDFAVIHRILSTVDTGEFNV